MTTNELPSSVPVEHQAKSCGALAWRTERINCVDCSGTGRQTIWFQGKVYTDESCAHCDGKGELKPDGSKLS